MGREEKMSRHGNKPNSDKTTHSELQTGSDTLRCVYLDLKKGGAKCRPFVDDLQKHQFGFFPRFTSLLVEVCNHRLESQK